ncbi:hypothetical protein FYK55_07605 [Roseiconus nitratireducens]|uniref:Transposase IS200-like domain-containing protein n=1 Tax=Roseiconus nitratireducens TaxID=2605748 RepID=A0A5M6DGT5_9BACT|nr:hypothetical protein FYK55_07605 [Roseiconus nitratireducens]
MHWTMSIDDRRTGWLVPAFKDRFRELLTHAAFRYAFVCPVYCLMPDHMHLVWAGVSARSDQLKACRYFRKHVNTVLRRHGYRFQHQAHDRVLREDEREESAFITLVEYVARNPERKGLVPPDCFSEYRYTGCLIPGHPELEFGQPDYWLRFWRAYSFLQNNGLFDPFEESV